MLLLDAPLRSLETERFETTRTVKDNTGALLKSDEMSRDTLRRWREELERRNLLSAPKTSVCNSD